LKWELIGIGDWVWLAHTGAGVAKDDAPFRLKTRLYKHTMPDYDNERTIAIYDMRNHGSSI